MISSYLEAMKMAVAPTSWSLFTGTLRRVRKRSMMLTVRKRVSGRRWKRAWTWISQSIRTRRMCQPNSR